jgi:hypothetical protein
MTQYNGVVQWRSTMAQYNGVVQWRSTMTQYNDAVQWRSTMLQYNDAVQWRSTMTQYNGVVQLRSTMTDIRTPASHIIIYSPVKITSYHATLQSLQMKQSRQMTQRSRGQHQIHFWPTGEYWIHFESNSVWDGLSILIMFVYSTYVYVLYTCLCRVHMFMYSTHVCVDYICLCTLHILVYTTRAFDERATSPSPVKFTITVLSTGGPKC